MSVFSDATDLADWLAQRLNMPFREAHCAAGRLVALAEGEGVALRDLSLSRMRSVEPRIDQDVFNVLGAERSVARRVSYGGTAPDGVARVARRWIERLEAEGADQE